MIVDADRELLARLRAGDEAAFMTLVDRYGPLMLRVALMHVRTRSVAEEVVQEAWLGVLRGLDRFEGRSTLKTWILRIVTNLRPDPRRPRAAQRAAVLARARRRRAVRRPAPLPAAGSPDVPRRLGGAAARVGPPPGRAASSPTRRCELVREAIDRLPTRQQEVITLRDVEGWDSDEVCSALDLSEGNQRVLLHRARSKVRQELEDYFEEAA